MPPQSTLADLKPGQTGLIEHIHSTDRTVQRLMVLGLVEGAPIRFIRAALGGDPMEFNLYGVAISLRRDQARKFGISLITADG